MAVQVKVGTVAKPTATGSQSVTGVGFKPRIVVFFVARGGLDSSATSGRQCIGWSALRSDNTTIESRSHSVAGIAGTPTQIAHRWESGPITLDTGAAAQADSASMTSLDADGFTLNWTTASSTTVKVGYLAIGGSDAIDASAFTFLQPSGTGSQTVTGLPFQSNLLVFSNTQIAADPPFSAVNGHMNIGFCDDALNQFAQAGNSTNNVAATASGRNATGTQAILACTSNGTLSNRASVTAISSVGFTLNWAATNANFRVLGLMVKLSSAGKVHVGNFRAPGSAGNSVVTGVGFKPAALLLASSQIGNASIPTANLGESHEVSATDGTASYTAKYIDVNAANPSTVSSDFITGIYNGVVAGSLTSFDTDGFTLNWPSNPANVWTGYVAFGAASAPKRVSAGEGAAVHRASRW